MMSHEDRRLRRKKIADYAKDHTDRETAKKFGITSQTVRFSRNEFQVSKAYKQEVPPSSYEIIAALIRGEQKSEIARRFGVSQQFIGQVRDRAVKHGVFAAVKDYATKNRDGN